ncbi:hypothetical protein HAX54_002643 [Datura stramonium]|uniref:Uncharacterized protein n=1 Tax=Datura stramonium TaxID=4076 RepID=A0ABS8T590_DATST|nr:hypothetical protein [Datura stramonium]
MKNRVSRSSSSPASLLLSMAAPRSLVVDTGRLLTRDEEELVFRRGLEESPTGKKGIRKGSFRCQGGVCGSFRCICGVLNRLFSIYLTMPAAEYGKPSRSSFPFRPPDAQDNIGMYAKVYPAKFILGYCSTYIFMQTFMIPGTIFMPIVNWLWPDKLRFFQAEICRRDKLLNYMLFLRITPTLPNLFINLASPIVDIPFHIFFSATLVGLIPAAYITVKDVMLGTNLDVAINGISTPTHLTLVALRVGLDSRLALGELKSVKDLYDLKTLSVLFLIGFISILPTILKRKKIYNSPPRRPIRSSLESNL